MSFGCQTCKWIQKKRNDLVSFHVRQTIVIAARMHCAINALAAQVPTLLIAYSQKAMGMCQYVYGSGDWVLPLSEFAKEDVLEDKARALKNQESKVRDYLSKRIPEIQQEAYRPILRLKEVLSRDKHRI